MNSVRSRFTTPVWLLGCVAPGARQRLVAREDGPVRNAQENVATTHLVRMPDTDKRCPEQVHILRDIQVT